MDPNIGDDARASNGAWTIYAWFASQDGAIIALGVGISPCLQKLHENRCEKHPPTRTETVPQVRSILHWQWRKHVSKRRWTTFLPGRNSGNRQELWSIHSLFVVGREVIGGGWIPKGVGADQIENGTRREVVFCIFTAPMLIGSKSMNLDVAKSCLGKLLLCSSIPPVHWPEK